MMPIRKTFASEAIALSYLEWPCNGKPLLLLHGLGDCAAVWSPVAEKLSDRYHVVAPDLRGHGESDKPANGYDFATVISDLDALMDALNWSRAIAIGHSWAGKLVAIWMKQRPDRLCQAILVDPFFIGRLPQWSALTFPLLYRVLPFLKMMGPFPSHQAAEHQAKQLKQYRPWHPWQRQAFTDNLECKPDGTCGSKLSQAARNGMFAASAATPGLTETIDTPTLLLLPDRGINRTNWQIAPYDRHLTQLEKRSIPGNHWIFLVQPEAFVMAINDFLENHPPS